jgi:hypothetical protein
MLAAGVTVPTLSVAAEPEETLVALATDALGPTEIPGASVPEETLVAEAIDAHGPTDPLGSSIDAGAQLTAREQLPVSVRASGAGGGAAGTSSSLS